MEVIKTKPRPDMVNWLKNDVEYDITDSPTYIDPDIVVQISEAEADHLEDAATELYGMCLKAVDKVIKDDRFAEFGIGPAQAAYIKATWNRKLPDGSTRDPELAGRFDFCWDGKDSIKFYEFNADTYTTAYECAVVQWKVVEDLMQRGVIPQGMSQFNSLEEKLMARLGHIREMAAGPLGNKLHFTCVSANDEDLTTTNYLKYLAEQAGWETAFIDIEHLGARIKPGPDYGKLVDEHEKDIKALYKLEPWEHLAASDRAKELEADRTLMLEPAWRAILSNKRLSVLLWEMYPGHPLLIPAYATPEKLGDTYVEKPIFGRIGAAIKVVKNGEVVGGNGPGPASPGLPDYGHFPKIYQEFHPLPELPGTPGWRFQTGIWVVGNGEVAGMDLRRDRSLVTGSADLRFVSHYMVPHGAKGASL